MRDRIFKFFLNLQFIFRPSFWLMSHPYSKEFDSYLNYLMNVFEVDISEPNSLDGEIYTVKFDDVEIWVQNYPYSYGHIYGTSKVKKRPSRLTIKRLKKIVDAEIKRRDETELYRLVNEKTTWIELR